MKNTKLISFNVKFEKDIMEKFRSKALRMGRTPTQISRELTLAFIENRLKIEGGMTEEDKNMYV